MPERWELRPDHGADRVWLLERPSRPVGTLRLLGSGPELDLGHAFLRLDRVQRRTLALWTGEGEPLAWYRRARRPWSGSIVLPGDGDDLRLRRGPIGGIRLLHEKTALARLTSSGDAVRPHVDAEVSPGGDECAVLLALLVVLLDELRFVPVERRAHGDVRWEAHQSTWDGLFGGDGGDGGGGGGGGD